MNLKDEIVEEVRAAREALRGAVQRQSGRDVQGPQKRRSWRATATSLPCSPWNLSRMRQFQIEAPTPMAERTTCGSPAAEGYLRATARLVRASRSSKFQGDPMTIFSS